MFLLSPAKVLVVVVVALVVLGPDTLPRVARQVGALWSTVTQFRARMESEVRDTFPDLPSTDTLTQAIRSPLTLLDTLAGYHGTSDDHSTPDDHGSTDGPGDHTGDGLARAPTEVDRDAPGDAGAGDTDWLRSLQGLGVDLSELN